MILSASHGSDNTHLHFKDFICDGRISPSEWDVGGYFDAEFLIEGRLVLYARFELVEGRIMEGPGNPASYGTKQKVDRAGHV